MKKLIALLLIVPGIALSQNASGQLYGMPSGSSAFGSDGTSSTQIGSSTFHSNGSSSTQIGSSNFNSNGTSNILANEILLDTGEYVGKLKKDKPNGNGVFTFNNGDVLDGKWKKGKFTSGTFTYSTGAVYSGKWKSGKFKGERLAEKE
jgi:hypothetical protein